MRAAGRTSPDGRVDGFLPGHELYRSTTLEAYYDRPRGTTRRQLEPDTLRPRWRWGLLAVLLLLLLAAAGLVVTVPDGPAAMVVQRDGSEILLALPGASTPEAGSAIVLVGGGVRFDGRVISVEEVPDAAADMVAVNVNGQDEAFPVVGDSVLILRGTRPLLWDLFDGGEIR